MLPYFHRFVWHWVAGSSSNSLNHFFHLFSFSMFIPLVFLVFCTLYLFLSLCVCSHFSQSLLSFLIFNAFPCLIHSFISNMYALCCFFASFSVRRVPFLRLSSWPVSFPLLRHFLLCAHSTPLIHCAFFVFFFAIFLLPFNSDVQMCWCFCSDKNKGRCYLSSVVW